MEEALQKLGFYYDVIGRSIERLRSDKNFQKLIEKNPELKTMSDKFLKSFQRNYSTNLRL